MSIQITGLCIYPVKGLRGIEQQKAVLTASGLHHDRHWMVVMPNGRMVTQRQMPQMAQIETRFEADCLVMSKAGMPDLIIPLHTEPDSRIEISIWNDCFSAGEESKESGRWFTEALAAKHPLRLVRMAKEITRPQENPNLEDHSAHFADAAPYLMTNEASLAALNDQLIAKGAMPVPMNRFRPNIVVKGLAAFEEYKGGTLATLDERVKLGLSYPSERCIVTTTDQESGLVDKVSQEPLTTLKQMQTAPGCKGAYFGENAVLLAGEGEQIRVGDSLI